ncbi:MAG: TIGR04283 family arsenosugar biosynthesis glycosyltransferase [Gudongella sp.]|nr:TIGR04283 family arsenosugar biosynthesis glycosyltransferase [Gudongella sp.]
MVSIIIPVLNEEENIEKRLKDIKAIKGDIEIIIVDGGSTDLSVEIAKSYGQVVLSKKGRASQMNTGAKLAKGDIFWFVHLDSKLNSNSIAEIENTIKSGYVGGCFSLYFYDMTNLFMKFIAISSNYRAKYLKLIFGDQGIFMSRYIYKKLGGYRDMELMEDWDISARIHKLGKLKVLKSKIGTSARKFKSRGELRTLLLMHRIKILYMLGVPTEKLAKMYSEVRE